MKDSLAILDFGGGNGVLASHLAEGFKRPFPDSSSALRAHSTGSPTSK
jgi:hypothetical protein